MKNYLGWLSLTVIVLGQGAVAADCAKAKSSEEVANCLGEELRASDTHINQSYQSVMALLDQNGQKTLRAEQRSWLKERDSICKLDSREPDRERWYGALLADYNKTVCVTRYTRVRSAELDQMLTAMSNLAKANADARASAATATNSLVPRLDPELFPKDPSAYWTKTAYTHAQGRWYWEVSVKGESIAAFYPTTLWFGCKGPQGGAAGNLLNIRATEVSGGFGDIVFGVALDLDDGKLYTRRNGNWGSNIPGSAKGIDVKLGRNYDCGVTSTIAVDSLIKRNFLDVNFGSKPFIYSLPDGYKPFAVQ